MSIITGFSQGVANGDSSAVKILLPEIEGLAVAIEAISVLRGGGRLLTDGDQALVAISHRTDIFTAGLFDDEDDILDEEIAEQLDFWWAHGISETDHVTDRLSTPELVAGPQTMVFHNGTGATTGIRFDITFHEVKIPNLTQWALLKQRTSYEGLI